MKKRHLALFALLPLLLSECTPNTPDPGPGPAPGPIDVENTTYTLYINGDTKNPYELVRDNLLHENFVQYNYKNLPELKKGDSFAFVSKKGDVIKDVTPSLSANNNLYNDPNTNEYFVVNSCNFATISLNAYKDYTSAYLSGYMDVHEYKVTYGDKVMTMDDVSDTKTSKDNWLKKFNATFDYDQELPFYFHEDELNLATTRKVSAAKQENNNVYEVEDEVLGNVFYGCNFTPKAVLSLLVYSSHFEVFMTGNESSTYVSMIGCFDSLETKEIRMPYNHDSDTASREIKLNYGDKFLISVDRAGYKPESYGFNNLLSTGMFANFRETDRTIELTCTVAGNYLVKAMLASKRISITGVASPASDYYAIFVGTTRYELKSVDPKSSDVNTYRSETFDVEEGQEIKCIHFADEYKPACQSGYNNLVFNGYKYTVYVEAKNVTFTLNVNKTSLEGSAMLSGYVPDYSILTYDKFNQDETIQQNSLVLDETNPHADEYEEYHLQEPINVYAYRTLYVYYNSYNVPATLIDEATNNLEVINEFSGEFLIKCTATNVNVTVRVYNSGETFAVYLEGYDEANYFPAVNLLIYDDSSSNVVKLKQNKTYFSEDGEIEFAGQASIAQGQHFAFINFERVPYLVTSWVSDSHFSVIEETYNYFLCEKDIEELTFILRIKDGEARFILS